MNSQIQDHDSRRLSLAALVLTRENALILVVPLAAWLALGPVPAGRVKNALALALGLCLLLVPVALRSHSFGGAFQITTAQLGPNLYIGNNPDADGVYHPLHPGRDDPRFEQLDARAIAEEKSGRSLSPAEVSSFYVGEVWRYVRERPLDWTALMLRKLRLVTNAAEIADTEDIWSHAMDSRILAAFSSVWHFGVLLPLAFAGWYWTWPARRRIWLLHALVVVYAFGVVLFFVFGRYRFPLVPLLILLAAAGVVEMARSFHAASRTKLVTAAALVLFSAVVTNWTMVDDRAMQSVTRFNYGYGFQEQGNTRLARAQYAEDVRLQPSLALLRRGEVEVAEAHFTTALSLAPGDPQTHSNLADAAFRKRDLARAEIHYRRSLELAPENPQTHNNLGIVSAVQGDLESAIEHFRRALALDPDYAEARDNLERALGTT